MFLSPLFVLAIFLPAVLGWGAVGHEIAATIAQIHLKTSTIGQLCKMLPAYAECHLAPVAAWADKVRHFYPWSAHMHYIGDRGDHPGDYCAFGENGWEDPKANILEGIRNTTVWLEDGRPGASEALKFLIHFFGDLHMPLHLTGRDRGGNEMKVRFDGRLTNLHSVWDSRMIAKSLRTIPVNYTRPLPYPQVENALRGTIYDPYVRQIMWEGVFNKWSGELSKWSVCPNSEIHDFKSPSELPVPISGSVGDIVCPHEWATPIHQLNCDFIWPAALDEPFLRGAYLELDTPEYSGRIKQDMVIEKLLAMAGIRLASVLNHLFSTE